MRRNLVVLSCLLALAAAGCSGDMSKQIVSNEALRNKVMDAFASNRDLALQVVDRVIASDSLRAAVVDHLLHNDEVAKQVIARIGTTSDAFDLVMAVAVRDSAMREHVLTLTRGIAMANAAKK